MAAESGIAADVVVVGAGAAGLATAIFTRELAPATSVVLVDGAKRPGAKILVSGGGRCNVTNIQVTERDFWGGRSTIVRRILRGFPVAETRAFFARIGVTLHEEANGKLFPDSNRARDVLEALMNEAERLGVRLLAGYRVANVRRHPDRFTIETSGGAIEARRVVLATGGLSLPKSGSDGRGYQIARSLGHTIVGTTPALAPLVLGEGSPHAGLSGVTHPADLTVWVNGRVDIRITGSLLWTHFGVSGPVALDVSRHWARAHLAGDTVKVTLSFLPGLEFDAVDAALVAMAREHPRATLLTSLSARLPASVAAMLVHVLSIDGHVESGRLSRDDRRRLAHLLSAFALPVTGTRGYTYAEVTAGGVPLEEVDAHTLESQLCPGLSFAGEILDVDGRLGGFNFQWAWSSARAVARGLTHAIALPGNGGEQR